MSINTQASLDRKVKVVHASQSAAVLDLPNPGVRVVACRRPVGLSCVCFHKPAPPGHHPVSGGGATKIKSSMRNLCKTPEKRIPPLPRMTSCSQVQSPKHCQNTKSDRHVMMKRTKCIMLSARFLQLSSSVVDYWRQTPQPSASPPPNLALGCTYIIQIRRYTGYFFSPPWHPNYKNVYYMRRLSVIYSQNRRTRKKPKQEHKPAVQFYTSNNSPGLNTQKKSETRPTQSVIHR